MTLEQLNELATKQNESIKAICIEALTNGNTPETEERYAAARKLDKYFTCLAGLLWDEERKTNVASAATKIPYDA